MGVAEDGEEKIEGDQGADALPDHLVVQAHLAERGPAPSGGGRNLCTLLYFHPTHSDVLVFPKLSGPPPCGSIPRRTVAR